MKYTSFAWLAICLLLASCSKSDVKSVSVNPEQELLGYVTGYAVGEMRTFRNGKDVVIGGVKLNHGDQLGQSMHPSIDQLKSMGFVAPHYSSGGDVSMSFGERGCNTSSVPESCILTVKVVVAGVIAEDRISTPFSQNWKR